MIKRSIFSELKDHLDKKEITLIVGPRQAGKTTVMNFLKDYLELQGKKSLFLNLDIEEDMKFFVSQEALLKKVSIELGNNTRGYVFIDEIQRKENCGIFLKGIYDMDIPHKLIVSGSGSVELKGNVHESLAGRKRLFELNTLSFDEFVNYKTDYKYESNLAEFYALEQNKTLGFLMDYLNFGGYPRVVLAATLEEKKKEIAELYQSYLVKDISYLLGVQKTDDFTSLIKLIASQAGKLANISEISVTLALSVETVKNYLWYLENTFVISKITPYFTNVRKELTKSPTFYFYDLGMRNYALGTFGTVDKLSSDIGFLFQNFVHNILIDKHKYTSSKVHFWRTKDRAEVDFVVNIGSALIPIEVKYSTIRDKEIGRSLHSFITKYSPKDAMVVHLGAYDTRIIGNTVVQFIPFYAIS